MKIERDLGDIFDEYSSIGAMDREQFVRVVGDLLCEKEASKEDDAEVESENCNHIYETGWSSETGLFYKPCIFCGAERPRFLPSPC